MGIVAARLPGVAGGCILSEDTYVSLSDLRPELWPVLRFRLINFIFILDANERTGKL